MIRSTLIPVLIVRSDAPRDFGGQGKKEASTARGSTTVRVHRPALEFPCCFAPSALHLWIPGTLAFGAIDFVGRVRIQSRAVARGAGFLDEPRTVAVLAGFDAHRRGSGVIRARRSRSTPTSPLHRGGEAFQGELYPDGTNRGEGSRIQAVFHHRVPATHCLRSKRMEAAPGFEPGNRGFADLRLSHLATPPESISAGGPRRLKKTRWSGKRDSNPRLQPWQGCTLPLSYSRSTRRAIAICSKDPPGCQNRSASGKISTRGFSPEENVTPTRSNRRDRSWSFLFWR